MNSQSEEIYENIPLDEQDALWDIKQELAEVEEKATNLARTLKNSKSYSTKVYVSGDSVEVYFHITPIQLRDLSSSDTGKYRRSYSKNDNKTPEERLKSRAKSNIRARNTVKRLIKANFSNGDKFITLTFEKNITDVKEANKALKNFKKKLRRLCKNEELKFIDVIEFQERGAIHYHMIVNLDITQGVLEEKWGLGKAEVKDIYDISKITGYMVKYMNKASADERLLGEKIYHCSKGLEKPLELVGDEAMEFLRGKFKNGADPTFRSHYKNKFTGTPIFYSVCSVNVE
ncbi:rolling circle replication-associated protein [Candidatus Kurthia intestinigallinarum]|nr:Rep protein [Kurthia sp. 3B1D]